MYRINSAPLLAVAALCASAVAVAAQTAEKPAQESAPLPPVIVETTPKPAPKNPKSAKKKVKPAAAAVSSAQPQAPDSGSTALGSYNPALDLPGLAVPPGTTITTAGPVYGYQALSAFSSTKTATPIEQIPQSIQVIPKSLIEDQGSLTVTETLRNVSNVQGPYDFNMLSTDRQPLRLRGFAAEQWLDGLPMLYDSGDRDSFANVERIEVLKGPSAILYGGGSGAPVGGAVNIVSKLPTGIASGELGFTFGSHSYLQPYFDINQPIAKDGTVLFRVTGEYTATDSYIDVIEQDRYSINPTLTLTNKTDTTLTIQGRKSKFEQQSYQGLPVAGTILGTFRLDRNLYIGPDDVPRSHNEVESLTVALDHRFDSIWSFNVKGRWSQSEFAQYTQSGSSATPLNSSVRSLGNSAVTQEQEEFTINPNLQARFGYGPMRNTLLFGADYTRASDDGLFLTGYGIGSADLLVGDFPQYVVPTVGAPGVYVWNDSNVKIETKGAYAQLQSSLYETVHILAGARLASIEADYIESSPSYMPAPTLYTTDKVKVLPRVGVVVDLFDGISAYASYSEGMRWVGQSMPKFGTIEPEMSEQREAGFKFNLSHELSGTVSVFRIDRDNVPTRVTLGLPVPRSERAEGFEADLLWQAQKNWKILASYGYVDVVFADSLASPAGNKIPIVPSQSGRLWVDYSFDGVMRGWNAGAGVYLSSGAYVDNANLYKTDGYFTVDAKLGYETETFAASVHVKNLTGEEYFIPYYWLGGQVAPGPDRALYGTVAYKY